MKQTFEASKSLIQYIWEMVRIVEEAEGKEEKNNEDFTKRRTSKVAISPANSIAEMDGGDSDKVDSNFAETFIIMGKAFRTHIHIYIYIYI